MVSAGIDYRHVSFAIVKTIVASMKHHTIPTLELTAALTSTRLKESWLENMSVTSLFSGIFIWTDSTTVLQWIRNNDKKQPVFVANIVSESLNSTTVDQWNQIVGVKNPTDMGARGISYPEVMESAWLQGPLLLQDEDWISHIDQILTNEDQHVEGPTPSSGHRFSNAGVSWDISFKTD